MPKQKTMMNSQSANAKQKTPVHQPDAQQKQRETEVREFAQHMRTWWKAIDPTQADKILKRMGIQA